ncbi:hypothetical protein MicloDRAFT_00046490 [Microvirga lotononidis]|uniref:Uncharacterized protein n=1 Tax=Microvirga lotononidis TaxID=864069 RepID=I4YVS9_9HYPH|nr:hypothetical protein MicloDRAFT_00046490 [Microvirga lotononidis]
MSRLAIGVVLTLVATAANAQGAPSGQTHAPAATSRDGTQPFLFDGRMKGDGIRRGAPVDKRHSSAGAIVVQPKASQPERE